MLAGGIRVGQKLFSQRGAVTVENSHLDTPVIGVHTRPEHDETIIGEAADCCARLLACALADLEFSYLIICAAIPVNFIAVFALQALGRAFSTYAVLAFPTNTTGVATTVRSALLAVAVGGADTGAVDARRAVSGALAANVAAAVRTAFLAVAIGLTAPLDAQSFITAPALCAGPATPSAPILTAFQASTIPGAVAARSVETNQADAATQPVLSNRPLGL